MHRRFFPILAGFGVLFAFATVDAGPPDPAQSTVPSILYEPGGLLNYEVVVRDAAGLAVSGAEVEITYPPAIASILCVCSFPSPTTAFTDANGVASFTLVAGGCIDPDSVGAAFEVRADAVLLASVGGVGPQVVDSTGKLPWQGWAPGGTCSVGLADAVYHASNIRIRQFNFCSDLDSDGRVSIIDAVLITQAIFEAHTCP